MSTSEFVHLHVYSSHSAFKSTAGCRELIHRATELRMKAMALTDRDVLFGAGSFYSAALQEGIQPIIGAHFRVMWSPVGGMPLQYPLILLAENYEGYLNLAKLSTLACGKGNATEPLGMEDMEAHCKGMIFLAGGFECFPEYVQETRLEYLNSFIRRLLEIAGQERLMLEINYGGALQEYRSCYMLNTLAPHLGLQCVLTNRVRCVNASDCCAADLLYAVSLDNRQGCSWGEEIWSASQRYLKSAEEMQALPIAREHPAILSNTLRVAEMCHLEFPSNEAALMKPPMRLEIGAFSARDYLELHAEQGARGRYGEPLPDCVRQRIRHELDLASSFGWVEDLLFAEEVFALSREHDLLLRTSIYEDNASILNYCLGITDIDPLSYGLYAEQFFDPRVDANSLWLWEAGDRSRVMQEMQAAYGQKHVIPCCDIDWNLVVDKSEYSRRLREHLWESAYRHADRASYIDLAGQGKIDSKELRRLHEGAVLGEVMREYRKLAEELRYPVIRPDDTYIVALGRMPLDDLLPVYGAESSDNACLQMDWIELKEAGYPVVALYEGRSEIIQAALCRIRKNHGRNIEWQDIPSDDAGTYDAITEIQLHIGLWGLDSPLEETIAHMKPRSMDELVLAIALGNIWPQRFAEPLRPRTSFGNGHPWTWVYAEWREELLRTIIERKMQPGLRYYPVAGLEDILRGTYGLVIFEEQAVRILCEFAGYSAREALAMVEPDNRIFALTDDSLHGIGVRYGIKYLTQNRCNEIIGRMAERGHDAESAQAIWSALATVGALCGKAWAIYHAYELYRDTWIKTNYSREYTEAQEAMEPSEWDREYKEGCYWLSEEDWEHIDKILDEKKRREAEKREEEEWKKWQ